MIEESFDVKHQGNHFNKRLNRVEMWNDDEGQTDFFSLSIIKNLSDNKEPHDPNTKRLKWEICLIS